MHPCRGVASIKKVGGKQLDISICPVNISMQRHCRRQEVVMSSLAKKVGAMPPFSKSGGGGSRPPCPPFSYPSALCRAKPCSAIGRAESQLEAPFSFDTSNALCILVGSLLDSSVARLRNWMPGSIICNTT